ncbi:hypothetical protein ACMFMG_001088 [Clarireedia jacksonii]
MILSTAKMSREPIVDKPSRYGTESSDILNDSSNAAAPTDARGTMYRSFTTQYFRHFPFPENERFHACGSCTLPPLAENGCNLKSHTRLVIYIVLASKLIDYRQYEGQLLVIAHTWCR